MIHEDIEKMLISQEEIDERCEELGKQISIDYSGKNPVLIGLLKGSVPFMAQLMRHITIDLTTEYMAVASYQGRESQGDVRILKDLDSSIKNLDVIIVEDIVDTGKTLLKVKEMLYAKGANSVKIVSMLDKPDRRIIDINADYVGFVIPNEFVVGFGLDYNQKYRNLPYIGILKESCYKE